MIKACIFDLDGTLADTLESMAVSGNLVLKQFSLKELPKENYKYYCGDGARMLVERILKDGGDPKLTLLEKAEPLYREIFSGHSMDSVKPYDGIVKTLEAFRGKGVKLGVCSNKPHEAAVKVVGDLFGDTFETVLGQREGVARKPAPDAPLAIADILGAAPEECMYIGDTGTDMLTGKAAGMFTVGALWGFRGREELVKNGADALAETPEDLIRISKEYER